MTQTQTLMALDTEGLPLAADDWTIDGAHSSAQFRVRHLMVSNVRGEFSRLSGNVFLDPADLTRSRVEVEIEAASLNTRDAQRDAHLRSADFFDAEKYPRITFQSKRIEPAAEGTFRVTGDLTIRGVRREVTFAVEGPTPAVKDPWGNVRVGIAAAATVNRKDFGLVWNALMEGGGLVVGDEVRMELDAELVHAAAQQAQA